MRDGICEPLGRMQARNSPAENNLVLLGSLQIPPRVTRTVVVHHEYISHLSVRFRLPLEQTSQAPVANL